MIQFGTALKSKEPPYHRRLVISDPQSNGGQVLLVRLTTDDGTWPDRDCILTPADWGELAHDSTVAYSTCKYGPAVKALEFAVQQGKFDLIASPSLTMLRQVILAAHRAAGMPPAAKRLLATVRTAIQALILTHSQSRKALGKVGYPASHWPNPIPATTPPPDLWAPRSRGPRRRQARA